MAASSSSVPPALAALRSAKKALRASMAKVLAAHPAEAQAAESKAVSERILASPTWTKARAVGIYVGTKGEVDTDTMCRAALRQGKAVYVPHFAAEAALLDVAASPSPSPSPTPSPAAEGQRPPLKPKRSVFAADMKMLRLKDMAAYEGLNPNGYGIRELGSSMGVEEALSAEQPIDLVLVPGVAFDSACGRLGHGKGYYDRYLAKMDVVAAERDVPGPVCVALSLRPQLLPDPQRVPVDEHDRMLDAIVHPDQVVSSISSRWVS